MQTPEPVVIKRGQKLHSTLSDYVKNQGWVSAQISGLGAVKDVELGYFDVHDKTYIRKNFGPEDLELIHLSGNVTVKDDEAFVHLHTVVSDREFRCYAGHLFEATVAITAELFITPGTGRPERTLDSQTGLNLITRGCKIL